MAVRGLAGRITSRLVRPITDEGSGGGGDPIPENAVVDRDGAYILDRDGAYIIADPTPRTS